MSRNVFILGAGASKEIGAPLMYDFLDVASDLARFGSVNKFKTDFDLVAEGRSELQKTHSKSTAIDLYNMEAVFSAFEMAKMLGKLGGLSTEKVNGFPKSYRRVIAETLEKSIKFPYVGRQIKAGVYDDLVEFIIKLNKKTSSDTAILSFNYDVALDFACHKNQLSIEYCLNEDLEVNAMKVLKLHGSLNWTECCVCKKIVPWKLGYFFQKYNYNHLAPDTKYVTLGVSDHLPSFEHCNTCSNDSVPFIVPPTWNKSEHHHAIENVWRNAAQELSEAENIFVIGYSLPETDTFFHYLYSLGVMSDQIIRRFWVIDPSSNVEEKYRKILGHAVKDRFRFINATFGTGIYTLRGEFDI